MAEKEGLSIQDIREESHSAKISGTRAVFDQILSDLEDGVFNGVLTWAPDRLSRNAGDLGRLVDLMDLGKLTQIRTYSQTFTNTPSEKFLLMILCSQAKLENDNRAMNVKRGIRAKCEMGWRPGVAPLGYFNRSFGGVKDIIVDPERAPMIQEMFERVAKHGQSGRTLKKWLDRVGFLSKGGKPASLSQVYLTLKNPFYYGEFEYGSTWYKGKHEPLITKTLYRKVQKQLVVPRKSKWGAKGFAFKGLLSCGGCGGGVIGEEKFKKLKDGSLRRHVYYHCSRAKDYNCKEPYINEQNLIKDLVRLIGNLNLKPAKLGEKSNASFTEYQKLASVILERQGINEEVTFEDYVKHILEHGSVSKKRTLIKNLNLELVLQNREIHIS